MAALKKPSRSSSTKATPGSEPPATDTPAHVDQERCGKLAANIPAGASSRLPVIGRLFTWEVEQPGDDTTLFRGTPATPGWDAIHGPGFRGVYSLADLSTSVFALTPGQSGNPIRAQASSLMHYWRGGATLRLDRTAKAVETIELHP